ncbi:MAG TPA: hypothetical protein PLQ61_10245 [Bacteroidales bacterium]|nr:hypothetical protein [Bacteroidales bacterium]HQJ21555.1 hypothetical protein [Bacteroidales bacterium]
MVSVEDILKKSLSGNNSIPAIIAFSLQELNEIKNMNIIPEIK